MIRRGITPVVAIALLMGMTVVASGGAYTFFTTATQQGMDEASASLSTEVQVRSIRCEDTSAVVGISNTGDRELAATDASVFLYEDGELLDTVSKDVSGADVLQPGGFSELKFPFTTYLSPGTRYTVEVSFDDADYSFERTCQGQSGNLIGYWNFDEISSRTISDLSVNGNDGTFNGMEHNGSFTGMASNGSLDSGNSDSPSWNDVCAYGDCLEFDGTDDGVVAPHSDLFAFEDGPFTVSVWIKTATDTDNQWLIDKGYDGAGNNRFLIGKDSGGLRFYGDGSWQSNPVEGVFDGEFHHVAMVRNGSSISFYVDGALDHTATIPAAANFTNVDELAIGQRSDNIGSHVWNGSIDDLRIYDRALSAEEIQSDMDGNVPADDIAAYYPFDEGSGQTAWNNAFQAPGVRGRAVRFDGVDDCIDLPDVLPSSSPKSAGGWFKLNEVDESQRLLALRGSARILLWAAQNSDGYLSIWQDGNYHVDLTTVPADEWVHLFMVDDGSTVTLYKDGGEVASFASTPAGGGQGDSIGCDWGGIGDGWADYTNGSIDDIRIYDRALSASEIQADMNGEPPASGIVGYYSMDDPTGRTVWNSAFWEAGPNGGVLRFDGGDDEVVVPYASNMDITDTITMAAWVKHDGDPDTTGGNDWRGIVSRDSDPYRLLLEDQGAFSGSVYIGGNRQKTDAPTSVFSPDTWHHAVYTYTGSSGNATLYVDGSLAVTQTKATGSFDTNTNHLVISGAGTTWNGTLDEIRLYDTVLSTPQVRALYAATR